MKSIVDVRALRGDGSTLNARVLAPHSPFIARPRRSPAGEEPAQPYPAWLLTTMAGDEGAPEAPFAG